MLAEARNKGKSGGSLCAVLVPDICSSYVLSCIINAYRDSRLVFIYKEKGAENLPAERERLNITEAGIEAIALDLLFVADTICCAAPKMGLLEMVTACRDEDFFASAVIKSVLMNKKTEIVADFDISIKGGGGFFRKVSSLIEDLAAMNIEVTSAITNAPAEPTGNAPKDLITENDIHQAAAAGNKVIECASNCIITPLARDTAREKGVDIIRK